MIYHTGDGGQTWTPQNSGTAFDLNAVFFLDAVTGWAVGRSGTVLHTTDGGAAWTPQDGGLPAFFTDVHFADADHGWISTHERLAAGTSIRVTTDGGTTWNTVTTGATFDLRGVYFVDASTGWIVGVAGEILRTDDGGVTWTPQTDGLRDTFWDVAALNPDTVLVVGPGAYAFVTDDGGATWAKSEYEPGGGKIADEVKECKNILKYSPPPRTAKGYQAWAWCISVVYTAEIGQRLKTSEKVSPDLVWTRIDPGVSEEDEIEGGTFADSLHGWIIGSNGMISHTPDGGETWMPQNSGVTALLDGVFFHDREQGWVVGDNGTILHTTDGGQNWISQTSGTTRRLRRVSFADDQIGWAVGDGGTILYITDGGLTWTPQTSGTAFRLYDIAFADDNTGWIVGDNGTILHSTDAGLTWTPQPSGTTNALLGIDFIDADNGWISGEGGTILRFTGTGGETGTGVEDEPDETPSTFALSQNYPNPFNPATTIAFTVARQGPGRLEVFDVLGRLVETLVDEPRAAGTYRVTWEASSLPSGVYLYRLQASGRVDTKRMVLIR